MNFRLPQPKYWQEFESLCLSLWKEIWNDPSAQKNGRAGQPQAGIDIWGKMIYKNRLSGIQCKDKNSNLRSALSIEESEDECKKALSFSPNIANFTIATTSPRDAKIQEELRKLCDSQKYPFTIDTWSWDDIEEELVYRPSIMEAHYSNFKDAYRDIEPKITITRYSAKDHLAAFFTRANVANDLSKNFIYYVTRMTYELCDNSYKHGSALEFRIKKSPEELTFFDNGIMFNPIVSLNGVPCAKSNIGSLVFNSFLKKFDKLIEISYERVNEENVLHIKYSNDIKLLDNRRYVSITIAMQDVFGRDEAVKLAHSMIIDRSKSEVIIDINDSYNMSALMAFIYEAINMIDMKQKLTIYIPRGDMEDQIHNYIDDERVTIITK